MKKLFTIIAVASMMLTTVFGFTSCQKDEVPTTKNKVSSTTSTTTKGATNKAVYVTVTSSTPDKGYVDVNNLLNRNVK